MDSYNNYIGLLLDGRYKLRRLVGVGGMAMVFEADDMFRKMTVAVKILKEEFATDDVSVQRFINESKAVLMLSHANIVKIYDVSVKGEHKYIVMEYIDGITLKAYMERKGAPLSVSETISYSIQILRALEHAHLGGIVHRDIKPQNIMLLRNGQIKVTDFGIAKLPDAKTLTATDKAIGTVYYISPEQAAGEKGIDRRTDLYSVGVVMYEMITGKLPFDGENPVSIALKQINEQPLPPSAIIPTIPRGLEQIILFAMEKDKEKRFQTATQMIDLLQKVKENPGVIFRQKQPSQKGRPKKRKNSLTPIILGVILAFLVSAIGSVVAILRNPDVKSALFGNSTEDTITVTVEDYVGKTYDQTLAEELKKTYRVTVRYEYSETAANGTIIRQSPKAGETRKGYKGQQIADLTLYVSRGIEELVIGDYAYSDKRQAQIDLKNQGLKVTINEEYDDNVPSGCVISTVPAAGSTVAAGSSVVLNVSKGELIDTVIVPSFLGTTTVSAYEMLVQSDLRLGTITYEYSETAAEGKIIGQSIAAGSTVAKGVAKINFVISKGPAPVVTTEATTATTPNPEKTTAPESTTTPESTEKTDPVTEETTATTRFDDWLSGRFG